MLEQIDHFVVLMFENRSFDNLLGHLDHIDAEDGICGRDVELRYPGGATRLHTETDWTDPSTDPGESWANTNVQMYGKNIPVSNMGLNPYPDWTGWYGPLMQAPYNLPDDIDTPPMNGAALDFFGNFKMLEKRWPTDEEMRTIAACYTPESLPVLNGLAANYATFTHWHCEVPTCTYPNRSFYHCGTSRGRLDNQAFANYAWDNNIPSSFQRFASHGYEWRVYYDRGALFCDAMVNLGGLTEPAEWIAKTRYMESFYDDCASGDLATYSFIEPRMWWNTNDYHPPGDVRRGEALLSSVYEALRSSPKWRQTALVVLFDEHGGCYDHVPPPAAPIPDEYSPGEFGFGFDQYGLRVPAIVVSPWIERGTVIRDQFSSCSMLTTFRERFDLGSAFTKRDAAAPSIERAFNLTEPRTDRPEITALDSPTEANSMVSGLGRDTMRVIASQLGIDFDHVPVAVSDATRKLFASAMKITGIGAS